MKTLLITLVALFSSLASYAGSASKVLICNNGWQKYALSSDNKNIYETSSSDNISDSDITSAEYENTEGKVIYNAHQEQFSVNNKGGGVPLVMKTIKLEIGQVIVLRISNQDDHSKSYLPCYWRR